MTRCLSHYRLCALLCCMAFGGLAGGCGSAVDGPRFWWDDQTQEELPADYMLPPPPPEAPQNPEVPALVPDLFEEDEIDVAREEERAQQSEGIPVVTSSDPDDERIPLRADETAYEEAEFFGAPVED